MVKKKALGIESLFMIAKQKTGTIVQQFVEEKITKRLIKFGEVSIAFLLGFVLLLVGIAQYLAYVFSFLENGLNYIVLGTFLVLLAYVLNKSG